MAYLITHFWPGASEDQYRATVAKVHPPEGLPEGQLYHAAGPSEGGILIAAVWDSKERYESFLHDKLIGEHADRRWIQRSATGTRRRDREPADGVMQTA